MTDDAAKSGSGDTHGRTSGTAQCSKSAVKFGPTMAAVRATLCSSTESFSKRHTTKNSSFEPDRGPSSPARDPLRPSLSLSVELRRRPSLDARGADTELFREASLDDGWDRGLAAEGEGEGEGEGGLWWSWPAGPAGPEGPEGPEGPAGPAGPGVWTLRVDDPCGDGACVEGGGK